jgi:hypothetical protein
MKIVARTWKYINLWSKAYSHKINKRIWAYYQSGKIWFIIKNIKLISKMLRLIPQDPSDETSYAFVSYWSDHLNFSSIPYCKHILVSFVPRSWYQLEKKIRSFVLKLQLSIQIRQFPWWRSKMIPKCFDALLHSKKVCVPLPIFYHKIIQRTQDPFMR